MSKERKKRPPREGFRRRINSYYEGMTKKQIALDTAKTAVKWLLGTVFLFVYWLAMLLLASIFLLNIWKVSIVQILIYSAVLGAVSSAVYAYILVRRKFYY